MLVISRTRDESIMIGDDIQVVVVDIRGDKVRLGVRAPQEVPVHRIEVYQAIVQEYTQILFREFGRFGITEKQCEASIVAAKLNEEIARTVMRQYICDQQKAAPTVLDSAISQEE